MNFIKFIKEKVILILITLTIILFVLYLTCPTVRNYIFDQRIDPSLVLGFLAIITLMITIWQNKKDRKLTYNLNVWESVRDNGLSIIGKLVAIRQKSDVIFKTLQSYQDAIKNKKLFVDHNDTVSKKDIDDGFQIVAAYADTYFREECDRWNEMLNKLNEVATDNVNVIKNYEINLQLILNGIPFKNSTLDRLDDIVANAEKTTKEIDEITIEMRNKIIQKTNSISDKIKSGL